MPTNIHSCQLGHTRVICATAQALFYQPFWLRELSRQVAPRLSYRTCLTRVKDVSNYILPSNETPSDLSTCVKSKNRMIWGVYSGAAYSRG